MFPSTECHVVPAETLELRQRLLILTLASQRCNTEAVLKIFELSICGDIYDITDSFCKNMLNIVTPEPVQ